MSQLQPLIQPQQTAEPLLDTQEIQFWLDKAVAWGQAGSPDAQRETCLHLTKLRGFLQQLLTHINNMSSTTETMKKFPFLGQFLGRLCWNPCVTADVSSRRLLFECLWGLYSEHPGNAVERKANQWIQKVLCQLATEEDDAAAQALMKHTHVTPEEYYLKVLRKRVALLRQNVGKSCSSLGDRNQRCSCDSILATSEACVPLVSCPEAAPLIDALLQQPVACVRAALSKDFLDALSSAYSSKRLSLEEQTVVSLWYHNLPSLEEAVLSLLECVLTNTGLTPQKLQQQLAQSLLPKACAQHCSIFLVVNDIFRSILKQAEENQSVKNLIQTFTGCFLVELASLQHQTSVSLKALFPQAPQSLLVPLLTPPSEMPQEAWRHHLNWLSSSLQRLTEEEEEEDGDSNSIRGHHKVFEAWFLLVQCAHWVQVAVQLLVTSGPEDSGPLLWLLTFYHHPTNRGHHRALQLVRARETWEHLNSIFLVSAHPLPVDRLQSLINLLSPQQQSEQPSLSPLLIINLLVNFAVFFQQSLSGSTEILQTVVDGSDLVDDAVCVLSSLDLRLNEGSCLSIEANRVHLRIKALQNALTHIHAPSSPAESQTHTHSRTGGSAYTHINAHNRTAVSSSSAQGFFRAPLQNDK